MRPHIRLSRLRRMRRWLRLDTEIPEPASSPQILHHRRCLGQFGLLHALNNLFQGEATFTRSELNGIARSLWRQNDSQGCAAFCSCLFNSHYNVFTGNYDMDVLLSALQEKEAVLGSKCDPAGGSTVTRIDLRNPLLVGFILHYLDRAEGKWTALRKLNDVWYDLDSYIAEPRQVGETDKEVWDYLDQCFARRGSVTRVMWRS